MTLLFPYNDQAQTLCDRGRYAMMNPIEERINVAKDPYDREYRKHVFNTLGLAMYKVIQSRKAGIIDADDQVRIFSYWKNYGAKVLTRVHEERTAQNAAKSALKGLGLTDVKATVKGNKVIIEGSYKY